MKNVNEYQLKKCIFKEYDEFKEDVAEALGNHVQFNCDYDGFLFECDEDDLPMEKVLAGMSEYYDVEVTSIHIDDCEIIGVWIVYR